MSRRCSISFIVLLVIVLFSTGCKNKTANPIANVDSKQPDKVLFDRAMDALKHNKFDVTRLTLQTLINTYPDSEFIARAKLGVCDSWLAEGGSAAMAQAEVECKDFITFFPNMPEAAEAQLKVAGIHYKQMEKPDRDYTHAKRAEDEYRQMLLQFPDSSLVPEAKQKLLQIQEVLAEREFRIGRFYFLRQSWAPAIARLRSLIDGYPLYSQVDEALFMLGESYEAQADMVRASGMAETTKANLLARINKQAADSFSKIITRYPAMERAEAARERLKELNFPVPTPTPEALAQSKAEEESRGQTGKFGKVMMNFKKRPDMAQAVTVGEPTLVDARQTNATEVVKEIINAAGAAEGTKKVTAETIKDGKPGENQPVPRSDSEEAESPSLDSPPPAPAPTNDASVDNGTAQESSSDQDKKEESSSKKKKKKGFRKLIPF